MVLETGPFIPPDESYSTYGTLGGFSYGKYDLNDDWTLNMIYLKAVLIAAFALLLSNHVLAISPYDNWPDIRGPYLGQEPPGLTAKIFAQGIISTEISEINSVFSPDRDEFYFTTWTEESGSKILFSRQIDGRWRAPEVAPFSKGFGEVDVAFTHDGKRAFFGTRRPRPGETKMRQGGFDIWFADRTESGWGEEQYLGAIVNSGIHQVYATATDDGTLYFQAKREQGYGKADIYRSRLVAGIYQTPENLGPVVNSEKYEGDVFIAGDESYLIVSISGREDGFGSGDLYVSFAQPDGSWSMLRNMGRAVNSDKREFCPMVTPDGKYLFFTSKRLGEGDIYWVDAKVIEALAVD